MRIKVIFLLSLILLVSCNKKAFSEIEQGKESLLSNPQNDEIEQIDINKIKALFDRHFIVVEQCDINTTSGGDGAYFEVLYNEEQGEAYRITLLC